ncbi:MAG TPA: histidine kinase [Anaerolineales bacterium]|nr:histidine kinase [Anaerolineales bacterium]
MTGTERLSGAPGPQTASSGVDVQAWLSLALRVIWSAGVALAAGTHGLLTGRLVGLMAGWIVLSLAASLLTLSRRTGPWVGAAIDLASGLAFIGETGLGSSALWWTPLIAGTTAGLAYGFVGGLSFAGIGALAWMLWILLAGASGQPDLLMVGQRVTGLSLGALVVGGITQIVHARLSDLGGLPIRRERRVRVSADTRALLRIAGQLNDSLSGAELPELVLDLGMQVLAQGSSEQDRFAGALLLDQGSGLRVVAGHGFSITELDRVLPGESGALAAALSGGEPSLSHLPTDDPELGQLASLHPFPLVLCIPLRKPEQIVGALLCAHTDRAFFTPARIELLQTLGVQATTALRNARLVRDLELERDRITETEEEARKKLARDLHDGPTQTIAAIAMRLNYARRLIERDPTAAGAEIHKLEDIARQTTREIRHMLFTLRPLVLESKGLVPALGQLAAKVAETHGQQVILEADPASDRGLDPRAQAVAFFIAEEAINNARKHAEAEHVWVRVRRAEGERFILEVEDDGVGFNVGSVDAHYEQRGSLGIVNMRERAELIRAALRLESAEGKGTHITLEVPLDGALEQVPPQPESG